MLFLGPAAYDNFVSQSITKRRVISKLHTLSKTVSWENISAYISCWASALEPGLTHVKSEKTDTKNMPVIKNLHQKLFNVCFLKIKDFFRFLQLHTTCYNFNCHHYLLLMVFKNYLFLFLCALLHVSALHACLVPSVVTRGHWISQNWSYLQV